MCDSSVDANIIIQHADRAKIDADNVTIGAKTAKVQAQDAHIHAGQITGEFENLRVCTVIGEAGTVIKQAEHAEVDTDKAVIVAQRVDVYDADKVNIAAGTVVMHSTTKEEKLTDDEIRRYEKLFIEKVRERTEKQTSGGITDDFKKRKLVEPRDEFTPLLRTIDFYEGGMVKKILNLFKGGGAEYKKEHGFAVKDENEMHEKNSDLLKLEEFVCIQVERGRKALAGQAGSGKTTMMKRIARAVNSGKLMMDSRDEKGISHRVEFVHFLNIRDIPVLKNVSPCDLLFRKMMPSVEKNVLEYGYKWLIDNHAKAVLVLDGLDQASWSLSGQHQKMHHFDTSNTANIMYNILTKNIFPELNVIVSSREHTISRLPVDIRPDFVAVLAGFTLEDRKKLFIQLAGDNGEELWEKMCSQSPGLVSLCSIPLFLLFIVIVYKSFPNNPPDTLSGIVLNILQIFMRSEFAREQQGILKIVNNLKRLSYKGTKDGRFLFTIKDLKDFGLDPRRVRDLVILVPGETIFSQVLMEGDYKLFFCHQSIQEMLTALFIAEMKLQGFQKFVNTNLHNENWTVVRRFLCGVLLNQRTHVDAEKDLLKVALVEKRREILRSSLRKRFENCTKSREKLELFACLYETNDTDFILSVIPDVKIEKQGLTSGDMYTLCSVLRRCHVISHVGLIECSLTSETVEVLKNVLGSTDVKLRSLDVSHNKSIGITGFEALGELIRTCGVSEVIMRGCDIDTDKMISFQHGIASSKITKLDISSDKNVEPSCCEVIGNIIRDSEVEDINVCSFSLEATRVEQANEAKQLILLDITKNDEIPPDECPALGGIITGCKARQITAKDCIIDVEYCETKEEGEKVLKFIVRTSHASGWIKSVAIVNIMRGCGPSVAEIKGWVINGKISSKDREMVEFHVNESSTMRRTARFLVLGSIIRGCGMKKVNLRACGLTADAIADILKSSTSAKIDSLDISSNCGIGVAGFSALGDLVRICDVKQIVMQDCGVDKHMLAEFQRSCGKIRSIDVSNNKNMEPDDFVAIGKMVRECFVTEILMRNCDINADKISRFHGSVVDAKILRLDISDNAGLGIDGFRTLGCFLAECPVKELGMKGCFIDSKAVDLFYKTLFGIQIQKLSMGDIAHFGPDEFRSIGSIIRRCNVEQLKVGSWIFDVANFVASPEQVISIRLRRIGKAEVGSFAALGDIIRGCGLVDLTKTGDNIEADAMQNSGKASSGAKIDGLDLTESTIDGEMMAKLSDLVRTFKVKKVSSMDVVSRPSCSKF